MRISILLFIFLTAVTSLYAQIPTLDWAIQIGGAEYDDAKSITTDADGNIYWAGYFQQTVTFGSGEGSTELISAGSSDIFIQKSDPNGNLIWVKHIGGAGSESPHSINVDINGDMYVGGGFNGVLNFDSATPSATLTTYGETDMFILKLTSDGDFIWVKQIGGSSYDGVKAITTDVNGNVLATGYFSGTADFNPGTESANLTANGDDIFILKLDGNGDFLWVKQLSGEDNGEGYSIATDTDGNVFTTGRFWGTVDFDPNEDSTIFTSAGKLDIFIHKLDADGNFLWARHMGSSENDYGYAVSTDVDGNAYVIGSFQETVDFDPGTNAANLTSAGDADIFIQKLDPEGNLIWVKQIGGQYFDLGSSITIDADGYIYSTGVFSDTVDFDPGEGTHNLVCVGGSDAYIQKLDANGNFIWAINMGGYGIDSKDIAIDINGNVYTVGGFLGTIDLDPGTETYNLTSNGSFDIYIQKLIQPTVGIAESTFSENFILYPNPTNGSFTIELDKNYSGITIEISNILGQVISVQNYASAKTIDQKIDNSAGVYFVNVSVKGYIIKTLKVIRN